MAWHAVSRSKRNVRPEGTHRRTWCPNPLSTPPHPRSKLCALWASFSDVASIKQIANKVLRRPGVSALSSCGQRAMLCDALLCSCATSDLGLRRLQVLRKGVELYRNLCRERRLVFPKLYA